MSSSSGPIRRRTAPPAAWGSGHDDHLSSRHRPRRIVTIASVAGALASAGALAGCGDAPEPGAATEQAQTAVAPALLGDAVNPDGNRERVWERAACAHHPEARAVPADASAGTAVSYDSSASATIIAAPSAETACLAIRS